MPQVLEQPAPVYRGTALQLFGFALTSTISTGYGIVRTNWLLLGCNAARLPAWFARYRSQRTLLRHWFCYRILTHAATAVSACLAGHTVITY